MGILKHFGEEMITNKLKLALLAEVFILGCTNLSYELIILRQLVNFMGSNTILTSIVITFILLFLSFGYYLGSIISVAKFSIRRICIRLMIALALWYALSSSYYIIGMFFYFASQISMNMLFLIFAFSITNLIAPAVMAGVITALIGRIIHRADRNYTGRFMAIDTIGSVLGSIGTTLILMPFIGVSKTIFVMVCISAAAVIIIVSRKRQFFYNAFFVLWLISLSFYANYESFFIRDDKLVKDDAISRLEIEPQDDNSKIMFINGQAASKIAENRENMFPYVKFINDNIIDNLPKDKISNILVLGAGGFTMGIDDERNQYTYLDIEKNLQKISEEKFLEKKLTPNKKFIFTDAYVYMINDKNKYDVIILDIYSALYSIPINFVTVDFLEMIKKHLAESGIVIANIVTAPTFNNKFSRRIDNSIRQVFKENLSRQIIGNFNPFSDIMANVVYTYYNRPVDDEIFTADKNSAMYGQY